MTSATRQPLLPLALALGFGAVFGGLVGALLGSARGGADPGLTRGASEAAATPSNQAVADPAAGDGSENVELLLGALIDEVRALRTSLSNGRRTAPEGPASESSDGDSARLVAALASLTDAVRSASGGGGGFGAPGWGLTSIHMPAMAPDWDLFRSLCASEDDDYERVKPYLLWNYQQVLDRFGPPDMIHSGEAWTYVDEAGNNDIQMRFQSGLLIRIDC